MRKLVTALRSGWRAADAVGVRLILASVCALFALSLVQLAVSVALAPAYVDWFLADHGWATRADAPPGEVLGIYIGIGVRCVFALFWVFSFTRLVEYVVERSSHALTVVVAYGLITVIGYGYWVVDGGPWWLTTPRALQVACGVVILASVALPRTRSWLRAAPAVRTTDRHPQDVG
ncbi:hypothetical protein [Williamsia deligens]|uniref:Integral membrane protein n=1 Tax=Williamsia deligens TaxID=321325 RepID=A0ABW3G3G4_9NOCA|nr:hypothetical protein [Williamsia deligens]MCP2194561.1 hypothetical protein [Williamsia deligens]